MKSIISFVKTTLIGGFFLVIPLVLFILIIDKVLDILRKLVAPITDLIAKTKKANELKKWIEAKVLSKIPGYTLLKGMTESAVGMESEDLKDVVLVDIEEVWQIGFLMDEIDDELSSVYIPGAPNPMSGDVFFVKKERLKKLDLPQFSAMKIYKKLGLDAGKILKDKINKTSF
ncbi:DUF502 domain-containing protein [uncultured Eudoraea sp.]|uniref:DUF502 domain-containing protein n=2 Tax=uncultured Eudoraea sp. TaxID=1035614 RepID=UPI00260A2BA5|nr:DUF502 domain-containing protein [uncultured Eudoraea sp.]